MTDTTPRRLRELAERLATDHYETYWALHHAANEKEAQPSATGVPLPEPMFYAGPDSPQAGHWFSPEAVRKMLAAALKPAPVLLTDVESHQLTSGCFKNGWISIPLYARAIEAAVLKKNGIGT